MWYKKFVKLKSGYQKDPLPKITKNLKYPTKFWTTLHLYCWHYLRLIFVFGSLNFTALKVCFRSLRFPNLSNVTKQINFLAFLTNSRNVGSSGFVSKQQQQSKQIFKFLKLIFILEKTNKKSTFRKLFLFVALEFKVCHFAGRNLSWNVIFLKPFKLRRRHSWWHQLTTIWLAHFILLNDTMMKIQRGSLVLSHSN